jgi:hypothetical protein
MAFVITARERVEAAASANGWLAALGDARTTYHRDGDKVVVTYKPSGGIDLAQRLVPGGLRSINSKDRVHKIIDIMRGV